MIEFRENKEFDKIFEKVLEKIKPVEGKFEQQVKDFIDDLNRRFKDKKINAKATIGGSFAKKTYLKNDFDVDVFVRFNYNKYKNTDISGLLFSAVEDMEIEKVQGSRAYYQVRQGEIKFELVPVLDIKDAKKAKNVMDMSPLHVNFIRQKLIERPEFADHIRIAKYFCKANNVYGAESYIKGLSGHVLDILIVYYGGFVKLLENASKWKEPVIVDIEGHYDDKQDVLDKMNKSKLYGPLIVVDPILPERNAAAALSLDNFEKFIGAAKGFLGSASEDYFIRKNIDIDSLKKGKNSIVIDVNTLDKREDIAGSKFVKMYEMVLRKLKEYGFEILHSEWEWDRKEKGVIVIRSKKAEKTFIKQGPPLTQKDDCKRFKDKNPEWFEKDGRLFVKKKREFTDLADYIREVLKDKEIVKNVKSVKILK